MGWGSAWLLRLALLAGVASDDEAATEAEMRQHFRALAEVLEQEGDLTRCEAVLEPHRGRLGDCRAEHQRKRNREWEDT